MAVVLEKPRTCMAFRRAAFVLVVCSFTGPALAGQTGRISPRFAPPVIPSVGDVSPAPAVRAAAAALQTACEAWRREEDWDWIRMAGRPAPRPRELAVCGWLADPGGEEWRYAGRGALGAGAAILVSAFIIGLAGGLFEVGLAGVRNGLARITAARRRA